MLLTAFQRFCNKVVSRGFSVLSLLQVATTQKCIIIPSLVKYSIEFNHAFSHIILKAGSIGSELERRVGQSKFYNIKNTTCNKIRGDN